MGRRSQFICRDCNYEATVSGGDDVGMVCHTTTISCHDCGELFDIVTSKVPFTGQVEKLVCPGSEPDDQDDDDETDHSKPDHRVERWTSPGPCPKCGKTMMDGGAVVTLWD